MSDHEGVRRRDVLKGIRTGAAVRKATTNRAAGATDAFAGQKRAVLAHRERGLI